MGFGFEVKLLRSTSNRDCHGPSGLAMTPTFGWSFRFHVPGLILNLQFSILNRPPPRVTVFGIFPRFSVSPPPDLSPRHRVSVSPRPGFLSPSPPHPLGDPAGPFRENGSPDSREPAVPIPPTDTPQAGIHREPGSRLLPPFRSTAPR